jgi:hypothetical protein
LKKLIIALFVVVGSIYSVNSQTMDLTGANVTTVTYGQIYSVDNSTGSMNQVPLEIMQVTAEDGTIKYYVRTVDRNYKTLRTFYGNGTFGGAVSLSAEWSEFNYSRSNRYSIDTDLNTPVNKDQLVCK